MSTYSTGSLRCSFPPVRRQEALQEVEPCIDKLRVSSGARSQLIIGILNEVEAVKSIQEVCREHGMSDATRDAWPGSEHSERPGFYSWRAKPLGKTFRFTVTLIMKSCYYRTN
jgi:hypothetical protein